jgi:hypothetical protein
LFDPATAFSDSLFELAVTPIDAVDVLAALGDDYLGVVNAERRLSGGAT